MLKMQKLIDFLQIEFRSTATVVLVSVCVAMFLTTTLNQKYEHGELLSEVRIVSYDADGFVVVDEGVVQLKELIEDLFRRDSQTALEFSQWIFAASNDASIEPLLLTSIIATESSFRKEAISDKGAVGPSQIMPEYWRDFCDVLNFEEDPRDNIFCAARILARLEAKCEDVLDSDDERCVVKSYYMGYPSFIAGKNLPSAVRYYEKVQNYKNQFASIN